MDERAALAAACIASLRAFLRHSFDIGRERGMKGKEFDFPSFLPACRRRRGENFLRTGARGCGCF